MDLLSTIGFDLNRGFALPQFLDVTNIGVHKSAHGAWLLQKMIGDCRFNPPAYTTIGLQRDKEDIELLDELVD